MYSLLQMWFFGTSDGKLSWAVRSKKRVVVAADGEVATEKCQTPIICMVCRKEVCDVVRCKKCSSGLYCSTLCVEKHESQHGKICFAIQTLERMEIGKKYREFKDMETGSKLPLKINREFIRLVGERPLVDVFLDGFKCKCLWDTGSMISLLSEDFLKEKLPNKKVYSIHEFLENELFLTAANNSEVPIEGVVLLDFGADKSVLFQVPFLVTKENVSNPIMGYNIIEHLVLNYKDILPSLMKMLPNLSVDNAKVMVSTIEKAAERSEFLGSVKSVNPLVLPGNCFVRIKCKTRVELGVEEREVLFSPLVEFLGEQDLIVYESVANLKRGKSQFLSIGMYNPTSTEIFLKKGTVFGNVLDINAIIQFPMGSIKDDVKLDSIKVNEIKSDNSWFDQLDLSHLNDQDSKRVQKLLFEEEEVFSKEKDDIGYIRDFKMTINLLDNTPVSEAYRQIPRLLYEDVKNHINNLLAHGWIKKSSSSYASPMVCARKKDGSLRLCCDFRKLNAKTIPDKQPIPRVQDILDGLGGQEYFSTLDMSQAYHQGVISEESRKFTAFSTPWSLYEWVRIPYGLTNAPPCFQRFINDCLYNLRDRICVAYLDDILIYGKTFNEHEQNVKTVLRCLKKKGIKLNPKKCQFFRKEVRYLGRLISKEGYRPDPENSAALNACKTPPRTVGKLRSLLGFLGYFRNFVKDFSRKLKIVYDLLKAEEGQKQSGKKYLDSRKVIKWLPEHQRVIDDVIEYLKSPEVIAYPDFKEPFLVHCDASQTGLGGVLYQKQEGKLRVISFASRTLTPAEKNYNLHSGKLEFLALKWCITEKFSDYLHYGPPFEVYTDNNPLTYVLTSAKLNASGLRWVSQLANYQFVVKYRPGKKHIDADFLSRHTTQDFEKQISGKNETLKSEDISIIFTEASREKSGVNFVKLESLLLEEKCFDTITNRISSSQLISAQKDDDVIAPVYDVVSAGDPGLAGGRKDENRATQLLLRQLKKLSLENNVLVRKTVSYTQIVLPKSYHHLVFEELHEKMGHLGSEKVVDLARKRFYWPYMQKDIEFYIRKKCRCIVSKKPNIPEKAQLIPIKATFPFEMVSIDFLHLDRCKGGYEYALIVCDHFTRFVQIFPTKNKSAKAAADQIFNKYILNYGFPRRIHHDQGKEFNNTLFARLHELTGIAASRTTPYHPMGDGQPERMNRTLINMLKCLRHNDKNNWKDHLAKLAFAYNSTVNKTTGFSPFYLMFGRESRLPIDFMFGIEFGNKNAGSYSQFVKNWEKSMKQAVEIAQKHINRGNKYNESSYNKKVRGNKIGVGDDVLLRNHKERGGTGKLRSYWEDGVYEVIAVDSQLPIYNIRKKDADGGSRQMKRVHRNNIMSCNDLLPEQEERVVPRKERGKKRSKKVLVRTVEEFTASEEEDEVVVIRNFYDGSSSNVEEDVHDGNSINIEEDVHDGDSSNVEEDVHDVSLRNVAENVDDVDMEGRQGSEVDAEVEDEVQVEESDERDDDRRSDSSEEEESNGSSSDSPVEVRRSARSRNAPKILTYDTIGGNPVDGHR